MWTTFLPDLVVAVFGAALTVVIAFLTVRRQQKKIERNELNRLITDLHHRRALNGIANPRIVPHAKDVDDFKHANLSVLDIRNQTKAVAHHVRPTSEAQKPLSRLIRSCNQYLEDGMYDPDKYHFHLSDLRTKIHGCVQEIAETDSQITSLEPGTSAY